MKCPEARLPHEVGFTQNQETGAERQSLIVQPLASRYLAREFILSCYRGWDRMLPGVFSYSKKNAIINYIRALGQHFHILSVIHSVSVRGGIWDLLKNTWESWDDGPPGSFWIWVSSQRELGIRGDRLGAAESHRQRGPGHLIHVSGAGAQELLWPAYPFARTLTPTVSLSLHLQKVIIIVIMSH